MRSELKTLIVEKTIPYTGSELSPHWILSQFRLEGSALVAFQGACHVNTESLVDWEDRLAQDFIRAESMVHFIGEFFGLSLESGVWLQRTLVGIAKDVIANEKITRNGDDLFFGDQKLSVSIVAPTAVSVLLHLGINIDSSGAPVKAIGLKDLKIDPKNFAKKMLQIFQKEWSSVSRACVKVRACL